MSRESKNKRRLERNKARIVRNKERKKLQRMHQTAYCDQCGGQMSWCEGCQMFSRNCCEDYGTCMCS